MYTIRTLNNIAKTGLAKLPEQNFVIDEKAENPEGIILRSFDMHKMELNESLLAVARAGAGTNNIPIEKCTQKGVPVFNTPGANANAVKELVLAGLFASSRRIIAGAAWVQGLKDNCESVEKAVEAGKKEFTGPEIAWCDWRTGCQCGTGSGDGGYRLRPLPFPGKCMALIPQRGA